MSHPTNEANSSPNAKRDSFHYSEDEKRGRYDGKNLLNNDSDLDGDSLKVTKVNGKNIGHGKWIHLDKGDVFVNQNGNIDFAANGDFDYLKQGETAKVGFDYTVSDGNGGTDTAHVTFVVEGKNDRPDAIRDSFHYSEDEKRGSYDGKNLLNNDTDIDGDSLKVIKVNGKNIGGGKWIHLDKGDVFVNQNGNIDFDAGSDFDYLQKGETAKVGFDYTVSDGNGGTDTAHVTFVVKGKGRDTIDRFNYVKEHVSASIRSFDAMSVARNLANTISPIAFDLNGDGVQTVSIDQGVQFDMLIAGYKVSTGWLSGEDAFLATDDNGNGIIDDRSELFGGAVGEGFAELASFDSNGDSLVNELDDGFSDLLLWQDANENGLTDSGELISLETAGITNLATDYVDVFSTDAQGNIHGEYSSAQLDGNSIDMVDVYFQVDV